MAELGEQLTEQQQELVAKASVETSRPITDAVERLYRDWFEPAGGIPYEQGNPSDLMALTFSSKQREHLRSVGVLIDRECHRDATLIARTMFEGSVQLQWAFLDEPKRTELWLFYGVIRDLDQLRENEERGFAIDPQERAELEGLLKIHGANYYTPKVQNAARKHASRSKTDFVPPRNPYRSKWNDVSINQMMKELVPNSRKTYSLFYGLPSEWVHWDSRTILRGLTLDGQQATGLALSDWRAASVAIVLAVSSSLGTLRIVSNRFRLGAEQRIQDIDAQLEAALKAGRRSVIQDDDRSI